MKKHLLIVALVVLAGASVVTRAQVSSTNMENALMAEGLTHQRAQELLAAFVPIGGIIPYAGTLPLHTNSNWQVCDGTALNPNANAALSVRLGGKTPNLIGRVPLGVASTNQIGSPLGTNLLGIAGQTTSREGHTHTIPNHDHDIYALTGGISTSDPPLIPFRAVNDGGNNIGWARFIADPMNNTTEGQHVHDVRGFSGGIVDQNNPVNVTTSENAHSHTISAITLDITPPSIGVVYIIRIY